MIFVASISVSIPHWAFAMNGERRESRVYLVTKNDCSELNKASLEISAGSLPKPRASGGCELDITKSIPPRLLPIAFRRAKSAGPNCFNSALMSAQLNRQPRFVTEAEMSFWMSSSACSARKRAESSELVLIYSWVPTAEGGKAPSLNHAYTAISANLGFTKNGSGFTQPWELMSSKKIEAEYGLVSERCRNLSRPKEGCASWSEIKFCGPPLKSASTQVGWTPYSRKLDLIEAKLAQALMRESWPKVLEDPVFKEMDRLQRIRWDLYSGRTEWERAEFYRADSLYEQMSNLFSF